jgi:peptide/nickel transport system permease protein
VRLLRDLVRICWSDKSALVGGLVLCVYIFLAIFGPLIAHLTSTENPADAFLPPGPGHLLGTDFFGRPILPQLILGTRPIMEVAVLSGIMIVIIGVIVGLVSGYKGGRADFAIMRLVDVVLTIPSLPLIIIIAAVVHSANPFVLAAILSVTGWAGLARAVRSQALSLREVDFVEAARIQGLPLRNIVGRQLLPNVGPYVAINFLLAINGAIYALVGLYLLGVAPVSGTNWGTMINLAMSNGALYSNASVFSLFAPMLMIVLLHMAFIFFSRALDQLFNPRLRVA